MSFVAKLGGFLLVPIAGSLVLRKVVDENKDTVEKAAYKGAAAHALVALASYYASEHVRSNSLSEFLTGGMWGTGVSAGLLAVVPQFDKEEAKKTVAQSKYMGTFYPKIPSQMPRVSGEGNSNVSAVVRLLTGHT